MFFDKRKLYNGDVATILAPMGINVGVAPLGILAVLDHAWSSRFSAYEGALLVAYSHATALYKQGVEKADAFTMSRLYPVQLDWLQSGLVRAQVIDPMTKLLKGRAYEACGSAQSVPVPKEHRRSKPASTSLRSVAVSSVVRQKPWLFNRANGQLIRRESGRTFSRDAYYREKGNFTSGLVIRDKEHAWASDFDIEEFG